MRTRTGVLQIAGGVATGCLAGALLIAAAVLTTAVDARRSSEPAITGLRDVLHDPPLLLGRGQDVRLRYDVVCQADERGASCPSRGTLFLRLDGERSFRRVPLRPGATEPALEAVIDLTSFTASGLSYYAVVEDGLGGSATVPDAGPRAPQRAWVTDEVVTVDLGVHDFGRARAPTGRRLAAAWGEGPGRAGLLGGKELVRIGPSGFDLAPDGSVVLLDQVNERLAVYPNGGGSPRYVPIPFAGGEGDVAVTADGAMHVLDHGAVPVVRTFSSSGSPLASVSVAGRNADMLRAGPAGPLLHGHPGDLWFPVRRGAAPLAPAEQGAAARAGRATAEGFDVVVRGGGREALFALVRGDRVAHAWRLVSDTDLGEVQLAEPRGDGLLAVLRVWTEEQAEFVAVELTPKGVGGTFAVDAVEWAESAALGRFRYRGTTLYQLRSAPAGVEVVTFDLGGAR